MKDNFSDKLVALFGNCETKHPECVVAAEIQDATAQL
jgi:hypothetical protein